MSGNRAHWGSRLTFILAAAGSAIGLGNIWKFPYITGVNGGGAFVLLYLICIFAIGVPILISEMYIGQKSQSNNVQAFDKLTPDSKAGKFFGSASGWLGLGSAFLILSFYSVIGGWILDFEFMALKNLFSPSTALADGSALGEVLGSPIRQTIWHALFISIVTYIVYKGVKDGLEKWNKILMPLLFALLVLLLIRTMFLDGFSEALAFLFSPDFSKLTAAGALEAVGHSFFTLSLGMGVIIVYGSYLNKNENIFRMSFAVAFLDTIIALLAGLVIFSVVFTYGLEPKAGPGLIFGTVPVLFAKMPGGSILSVAFFFMITFAAITSAVSMLEVVVAYWSEKYNKSRESSALKIGAIMFALGLLTVISTNVGSDIFNILGKTNFFDLFDMLTSSYMLPLGGICTGLYYGWVLGPKAIENTLPGHSKLVQIGLLWSARIIAPAMVMVIIIQKIKEIF